MDLEEIKKQKLQSLQQEMLQQQFQEQHQLQQQIEQLEGVVKSHLSPEAVARYWTLKAAHPEKGIQSLVLISELLQAGRLKGPITDEQYKALLERLSPQQRETKITRK